MIVSGLEFVSNIATIGIPILLASFTAVASLTVSITNSMSGVPPISLIPPKVLFNLP